MVDWFSIVLLIVLWLFYFIAHSVLASNRVKARVQQQFPERAHCYRLFFNLFAILTLGPIAFLHIITDSPALISWDGWSSYIAYGMQSVSIFGFIWSLRYYDMAAFSGIRSCRQRTDPNSILSISPLHRHVRHPWYFFALLLIWGRDLDQLSLVSTLMITAYLIIGSRLEDKKLIAEFGPGYAEYTHQVPGLIPIPGKSLSAQQSRQLEMNCTKPV